MTYSPKTLNALAQFWTKNGGVFLGVVGNKAHTVGYHLGRDRIYDGNGPGLGAQDYSVVMARDKAGLTDAAAAIDLGRLDGTLGNLYEFSTWLVRQCQTGQPGYRDIREIIYSPDGQKVVRYSGVDGDIHAGEGNGDESHITHTHISYFRDSEQRDKIELFRGYFEGASVNFRWIDGKPDSGPGTVTVKGNGHSAILNDGTLFPLPAGAQKHSYGRVQFIDGPRPNEFAYAIGENSAFLLTVDVTYVAAVPPGDTKHFVAIAVDGVINKASEVLV